jgi:hypothetical protein
MAYRELRRWLPAIRAAKAGGIRNGRYPGAKRISPAYTHALIEAGDEIEALKILGKHQPGARLLRLAARPGTAPRRRPGTGRQPAFQRYFADIMALRHHRSRPESSPITFNAPCWSLR